MPVASCQLRKRSGVRRQLDLMTQTHVMGKMVHGENGEQVMHIEDKNLSEKGLLLQSLVPLRVWFKLNPTSMVQKVHVQLFVCLQNTIDKELQSRQGMMLPVKHAQISLSDSKTVVHQDSSPKYAPPSNPSQNSRQIRRVCVVAPFPNPNKLMARRNN